MNFFARPPIVIRTVSNFHRTFVEEQPIICEHVNCIYNHHIKRNCFIPREVCCEHNDCCVENIGCCPNMPGPGTQPFFDEQMPGVAGQQGAQPFAGMANMPGAQAGQQPFDFMQGPFRKARRT